MTRHMTTDQLMASAAAPPMTRAEKLERWAQLVERFSGVLFIYHNLERNLHDLDTAVISTDSHSSAFTVALGDPVFQEAGLRENTLGGVQRFFELSRDDLHEFSCDCGGHIGRDEMASRLRNIAGGGNVRHNAPRGNLFTRAMHLRFA